LSAIFCEKEPKKLPLCPTIPRCVEVLEAGGLKLRQAQTSTKDRKNERIKKLFTNQLRAYFCFDKVCQEMIISRFG